MKKQSLSWLLILALSAAAIAEDPTLWKDGLAYLGKVRVDPRTRTVFADGRVNQVSGLVELLACGPGGKVHESVLVLDVNPLDLQTALLLIGLKPGKPPQALGEGAPEGPKVDIWVEWVANGRRRSVPAGQLVYNIKNRRPLTRAPWIFTGSVIVDGEFKALAEESLVATYWDPWAIINLGSPEGADDEIIFVNKRVVPPLDTPVTVRFSPARQ